MERRTIAIFSIAFVLLTTTWLPGGLSDEGPEIPDDASGDPTIWVDGTRGPIEASTLPPVSLRSLPDGSVAISLPNGTIDPTLPAAAPPGLGEEDPWVDANGDEMFGTLVMGANAIQMNGRALSATTDGRLQFDGTDLCLSSSNCAGALNGVLPIEVAGDTISLSALGCQAGDVWKWTGSSWACTEDVDTDTDTDTTYDGTDFALSDQACATGEVVAGVDASGNVACVVDQDTTSETTSLPWTNVTDKPAGFADDVDDDLLASLGCTTGQVAKFDGATWSCAEDTDTDTTYDGTDFALSQQGCSVGDVVTGVSASGNVLCREDRDALGSLFCGHGQTVRRNSSAGWECADSYGSTTTVTLSSGLTATVRPASICPVGPVDGPNMNQVGPGAFFEADTTQLNPNLNNCGAFDWYLRIS